MKLLKLLALPSILAVAAQPAFAQTTVGRLPEVVVRATPIHSPDPSAVQAVLARPVIGADQSLADIQTFVERRIPTMSPVQSAAQWDAVARELRRETLKKVIFRGEARAWRDASLRTEWLDVIPGGPGYQIRKLRYEAVPGLWIPALLYEPTNLPGEASAPVVLNVNGHDRNGKSANYKQLRSINLAKRGMLVLNVEWLGMGQLRNPGNHHGAMNQLDLLGTSGIAPFYLAMSRALDVVLDHRLADHSRVAVAGLSGGGWQTIFISSLDTRVTLANPVAGYSSFFTRARHFSDLGDSEQTPSDLATVVDYSHLTAMMAPRPLLLTYNAKDQCCFRADHALQPLLDAAQPAYSAAGKATHLQHHINLHPGDHNFGEDNREALYQMLGLHFFPDQIGYSDREIPSESELKTADQLHVPLPANNATLNSLARSLAQNLPRPEKTFTDQATAGAWGPKNRLRVREITRASDLSVEARQLAVEEKDGIWSAWWQLRLGGEWTVPVVEIVHGIPKSTVLFLADVGRAKSSPEVERLLAEGNRVLAVDPFYFGESKIRSHDWLFALLAAATGERPLGIQASQVAALARWGRDQFRQGPVAVSAVGPRTSTIALIAATLEEQAIGSLERQSHLASLKTLVETNRSVDASPELFCFGLLESFDIPQLELLVAPRPIRTRPAPVSTR